jgi:hypothetical protein
MTFDSLAVALRASAAGLYPAEAAAELLIGSQSWLMRPDFTSGFITMLAPAAGGEAMTAVIDWAAAVGALGTGCLPCGGGERRMLRLAASLAGGIPVDLGDSLTGLDRGNLATAATAVLWAGGQRDARITLPPDVPPCRIRVEGGAW